MAIAGIMNTQRGDKIAAESVALKIRWALILAAAVLLGDQIGNPVVVGVLALLAGVNFYAHRIVRDTHRYETSGARQLMWLRTADGVLIASAGLGLTPTHNLWLLSVPILISHGLVMRSARWLFVLAGLMAVAQVAVSLLMNRSALELAVAVGGIAFGTSLALVLASFQGREERLAARDTRLNTILSVGSTLSESSDLREMIAGTLRSAIRETRAHAGYVMLFQDDDRTKLVTEAAFGIGGEFDFPEQMATGQGLSGYVAQMGHAVSVSTKDGDHPDFDGVTEGVRAAACVPLVTRGFGVAGASTSEQILGVITLLDLSNVSAFQSEDMELLHAMASLLAVAVSNAQMEERRRTTFLRTMESLATALEARDEYTRGHSQRVSELSMMIGEKMGLGTEALEELRIGTILHDIGKIGVPDAILNKRARLTDEEFMVMRQHPVIGYEICRPLMLSEGILMIIRNHHEKLDGSGYPDGLKGGELPLSLRIVCVADAFDAMSSRRPYRGVMDPLHVQAELSKGAGTQFDPVIVEVLRELLPTERMQHMYRSFWEPMDLDDDPGAEEAA